MAASEETVNLALAGQEDVPCSVWSPNTETRGVVILGHGLGVDRHDSTVRRPVEVLTQQHAATVIVPEIPLHGVRDEHPEDPAGIVDRWQSFWVSGGIQAITRELEQVLSFCRESFADLPTTYFGLSLGTQYGIPFLAQTEEIGAAVLGLFGSRPPPKTPVMNTHAPAIRCPVYFVQKLDDEIHPAETATHLFESLGSQHKVLDATPGEHRGTSLNSINTACEFLDRQGAFRPA